ncbi:AAA family ATPase [Hyalangium gracile]|uniref:AAA family ATPase n=1 Tax=Hyalangium gracile TaxID=394092 RepID=UPI001CCDCBC5|nr:AAA family ATPase [Hyalangium gracile]
MGAIRIELLGGARIRAEQGETRSLEKKTAALLAYLALEGETSRPILAGLFWPDSREMTARNNLSQVVRRLRELTGEAGIEGRDTLRLSDTLLVDLRSLLRGEPAWMKSKVGPLLAGLSYDGCEALEDWLATARSRVLVLQQRALGARVLREEREGQLSTALELAQQLLQLEPTSEEAFRHLMRLHHRLGDRSTALQVWRQCEEVLRRELGLSPSEETRQLARELEKALPPPLSHPPSRRALPLSVVHPPILAGREREWARMERAWEVRQPMFVMGPPGVGKSRLMAEFARSRGRWLLLTARPGDFDVPYATHARSARTLLRQKPGLVLEGWVRRELSRLLPELGEEPLPLPPPPEEKTRFFAAVIHLLRQTVSDMDVIAYDDAQYSDPGSSELSFYIMAELREEVVARRFPLFVGSERIDETLWKGERMRQVADAGQAEWIQLDPLGPEAVQRLLRGMNVPALEDISEDITRYTGGNPLFIVETAKHLIESGGLDGGVPAVLSAPGRVKALIQKRLARLSPEALRLAQVLAVAQADVSVEQAAAAMETPPERLMAVWQELEEAALVRGGWFSHDLVGESVLAELPSAIRELLASRLARCRGVLN